MPVRFSQGGGGTGGGTVTALNDASVFKFLFTDTNAVPTDAATFALHALYAETAAAQPEADKLFILGLGDTNTAPTDALHSTFVYTSNTVTTYAVTQNGTITARVWGAGGLGGNGAQATGAGSGAGGGGYAEGTASVLTTDTIAVIVGKAGQGAFGSGWAGGYSSVQKAVAESSSNAYMGVQVGQVDGTSVAGNFSNAIQFDGVSRAQFSSGVSFGTGPVIPSGAAQAFTIECFVKFAATGSVGIAGRFSDVAVAGGCQPVLSLDGSSHPSLNFRDNGGTLRTLAGASVPSTGAWHHVVGVSNGTTVSLFVDGARVATLGGIAGVEAADATTGFMIGRTDDHTANANGGFPANAAFDEIRLSKNARYDPTLTTLTVPTSVFTNDANTVLLWHADTVPTSIVTATGGREGNGGVATGAPASGAGIGAIGSTLHNGGTGGAGGLLVAGGGGGGGGGAGTSGGGGNGGAGTTAPGTAGTGGDDATRPNNVGGSGGTSSATSPTAGSLGTAPGGGGGGGGAGSTSVGAGANGTDGRAEISF